MEFCRDTSGSGALIAPISNFLEAFSAGLLKQANTVASMLEFMNIGPHLREPIFLMDCGFAAGSAASVKSPDNRPGRRRGGTRQFNEDTAHFLYVFVGVDYMLVAQQKAKAQLARFRLSLGTGLKGPYSARNCSMESHAIQKLSLVVIPYLESRLHDWR